MSTDAVIDAIDGALRDRQVSADAMRWTPEPEEAAAEDTFWFEFARIVDVDALNEFGRRLTAAFCEMTASLGELSVPLVKVAQAIAHAMDARQRPRWHHRRCPQCNPPGFTTAAAPEMRDYRRRMKARARRARS